MWAEYQRILEAYEQLGAFLFVTASLPFLGALVLVVQALRNDGRIWILQPAALACFFGFFFQSRLLPLGKDPWPLPLYLAPYAFLVPGVAIFVARWTLTNTARFLRAWLNGEPQESTPLGARWSSWKDHRAYTYALVTPTIGVVLGVLNVAAYALINRLVSYGQ